MENRIRTGWIVLLILAGFVAPLNAGQDDIPLPGNGSPDDPYQIDSRADLALMNAYPQNYSDHFILTADIYFSSEFETFSTALIAYDPVPGGDYDGTLFTGVFNGNDHVIHNLMIDAGATTNSYLGLFGALGDDGINKGEIKRLGLENITIIGGNGSQNLGSIAGMNQGGDVSECYATGQISETYTSQYLGGLVGYNGGTVANCYAHVDINGNDNAQVMGGLVGYNIVGLVGFCYAAGEVSGLG
ncbi:MAG: hypothetical protein GY869_06475, partial [Planctomycetes bacterium]|nr:hypothetical protein [Planctomycetota bacterium]